MAIQWYPGHMTRARREMEAQIRLVDLVIELVDARAPVSSRNPDIDTLARSKARLIILNKADLADPDENEAWCAFFKQQGAFVLLMDARGSSAVRRQVNAIVEKACAEKRARDQARGIRNRPLRAMVAGIPNVGKSTFINSYAGKSCTKTGNKPGVTRGQQWIRLNKSLELLDTPGILWPKFDDPEAGLKLAAIGSISDDILNITEIAIYLIGILKVRYPGCLAGRYTVSETEDADPQSILSEIALAKGCVRTGGEPDTDRAAKMVVDDFRANRLGRITLDCSGIQTTAHDAEGQRIS